MSYKQLNVESFLVESDGVRLHVSDFGGNGPPLIMLHSTGFGGWMWQPMIAELSRRFHVYAPEQRGHGDSDKPAPPYTLDVCARDMEGLCRALDLGEIYGIGHSSGGTTLALQAGLYPGRTRRLLLVEPVIISVPRRRDAAVPADARPSDADMSALPNSMAERTRKRQADFASATEMFERFRDRPPFNSWRPEVLRLYCEEGTRPEGDHVTLKCPPAVEARYFEDVGRYDPGPVLSALNVPVRFLWGESSDTRPGGGPTPDALIPGSEAKSVPGTSHFLPMEKPEVVVREALDFFRLD